jgi:hypothetical protein
MRWGVQPEPGAFVSKGIWQQNGMESPDDTVMYAISGFISHSIYIAVLILASREY